MLESLHWGRHCLRNPRTSPVAWKQSPIMEGNSAKKWLRKPQPKKSSHHGKWALCFMSSHTMYFDITFHSFMLNPNDPWNIRISHVLCAVTVSGAHTKTCCTYIPAQEIICCALEQGLAAHGLQSGSSTSSDASGNSVVQGVPAVRSVAPARQTAVHLQGRLS